MDQPNLNSKPVFGKNVQVHSSATIMGQVTLGDDVSVWPSAVIRGDMASIKVGNRTNIQDGCVFHTDTGHPAIIGEDPLLRWWGFKYDSRLSGINVHADFAAVNVNFWITPDDANLDPESGGLVIWDTPAPVEWSFAQYNNPGAGQAIRDFLARAGAHSVTVPYRANRAVIFDSDLFHETDRIAFKKGYLNRRINITMLYGLRGKSRD